MKERYLRIMEQVVGVYTPAHIDNYIERVRENGIREHGFPRLCANIGILMAHGRLPHLKSRFEEMMALCCRDIPNSKGIKGKRGNDFSVREVLSAILELEAAQTYPAETIAAWKAAMALVDPYTCYHIVAPFPPVAMNNWAAFNAASEQLRCKAGLANTQDYIENQIASQMFSFDENGMYRDPHDPMVYDLVTRDMLSACLYYGYNGSHARQLNAHLRKASEFSLLMQSVTGELPYGGRSNQFLHNEAHMTVNFEYEASARKHTDPHNAGRFKAAANLALDSIEHWLNVAPGQHVKNYFPNDSGIGCEDYAYYDKYMVTIASFLYLAYTFCDDSIAPTGCPAMTNDCYTFQTGDAFRKLFCKAGSYFAELEWKAHTLYDAAGIGRLHRRGAPSVLCLSVPVSLQPNYGTEGENETPLSICCGIKINNTWQFGFDDDAAFTLLTHSADATSARAQLQCALPGGTITEHIALSENGLDIYLEGNGTVGLMLPAFSFDGKEKNVISSRENTLTVCYKGWCCRYETNGTIRDMDLRSTNRNGIYEAFCAENDNTLHVHITLEPIS